jgi:hypothetical protein
MGKVSKDTKFAVKKNGSKIGKRISKRQVHDAKLESIAHQALKGFRKVVKSIKALYIQKQVKRIADVRKSTGVTDESLTTDLEILQQLKKVDHLLLGRVLCHASLRKLEGWSSKLEIAEGIEAEASSQLFETSLSELFAQHKKFLEVSDYWSKKFETCIADEKKRLDRITEIKARAAAAISTKGTNLHRHISTSERSQAVFMDSLQDVDKQFESQITNNTRHQQHKVASKGKARKPGDIQPTDMNIYKPVEQRENAQTRENIQFKAVSDNNKTQSRQTKNNNLPPKQRQTKSTAMVLDVSPMIVSDTMHPSWVAKQQQKQKQTQLSIPPIATGVPMNKKIIFD